MKMKFIAVAVACVAAALATPARALEITANFTVPPSGSFEAGVDGNFTVPYFDSTLGTLQQVDVFVELTSFGGYSAWDSRSNFSGFIAFTLGTLLADVNFPGSALDVSNLIASVSSGNLTLEPDEAPVNDDDDGTLPIPGFTGTDAQTFSPEGSVTDDEFNSSTSNAVLALYQQPGGGNFTVTFNSTSINSRDTNTSGLNDAQNPQFTINGYIRYVYIPEPSSALLLMGAAGLVAIRRRRA